MGNATAKGLNHRQFQSFMQVINLEPTFLITQGALAKLGKSEKSSQQSF